MAIRYTPEFNKRIRDTLKNFNAKVSRAEAAGVQNLPEKIHTARIKATYNNRADLERRLRQLERFNLEKSKSINKVGVDNIKMSYWDYETMKSNRLATMRKVQAQLEKQQGIDRSRRRIFPSERTRQLKQTIKTLKVNPVSATANQLTRLKNIIARYGEKRIDTDNQFFENFFDMLWASVPYVDADEDTIQYIHDMIEQLTPDQLLEMYHNEPLVKAVVEDYNRYMDTQGYAITDQEAWRKNLALEELKAQLPKLIEKYKKF